MRNFGVHSEKTCLKYSQQGIDPDLVISSIPYQKACSFLVQLEQSVGREAFDDFIQVYISTHRFQSLTTEAFVAFLERELPKAAERADINEWLFAPGFPEDAPVISSSLVDDVEARVTAYESGALPAKDQVSSWTADQAFLFLRRLPERIPVEDCGYLESLFEFTDSRNWTLLSAFYPLCIRSGYQDVLPGVERLVGTVGRNLILERIFRSMVEAEWARGLARPMFERYRERRHPITVARIEDILAKARL